MVAIRTSDERGTTQWDWLDSRHTFSFGDYHDPRHMGYRTLRVLNDDRVKPGAGFGAHPHEDMEILSYVLDGALEHRDSLGNGSVIRPGEIQHMRAGRGVVHSEFNHSTKQPVHFLQIWIVPGARGLPPAYDQHAFDREAARRSLILLASKDGRAGSLALQQDVDVWVTLLSAGDRRSLPLRPQRAAWVHVARGSALVNGAALRAGDAVAVADEGVVSMVGGDTAEVLVFDLA